MKDLKAGHCKGFTLIEAMTFLFIFSVITLSFYQTWALGTQHIINAKNRLGATAIANEQMETIRGLIFDDIGTTTGIPTGVLAEDQTIAANNTVYQVHTTVQFVDDATDGTLALGTDTAPNDYKKVALTVSWGGGTASEQIDTSSIFSLDGVESVAAGTGILSVNVLDTTGTGVSGASVHIVNNSVSPVVNVTANTDTNGNLSFPGAPASVQGYSITVSKGGYYGNATQPPYPTSAYNPVYTHASIVAGSLTSSTLVTDRVSTIEFRTDDPLGTDVPDINFSITGGLVLGTNPSTGALVYDYSQSTTTNGSGERTITNRSTGEYLVTLDASETGYEFIRLIPEQPTLGTLTLPPGVTQSVQMILASKTFSSALITAKNADDNNPIAGASIRLFNATLSYDQTVTADSYGQAFFPTNSTPLAAGNYDVEITATGFDTETGNIPIGGSALEKRTFSVDPS